MSSVNEGKSTIVSDYVDVNPLQNLGFHKEKVSFQDDEHNCTVGCFIENVFPRIKLSRPMSMKVNRELGDKRADFNSILTISAVLKTCI